MLIMEVKLLSFFGNDLFLLIVMLFAGAIYAIKGFISFNPRSSVVF